VLLASTFVLVSASLWIAYRFHIPELQVLFLFHVVSSLGGYLPCNCEAEEYFRAPHCGMKPQCGFVSSKVAATPVMTPLVLARSAFSIHCVRAGALSTGTAAAARIFRRVLIAELDAFLCFWHFFLASSLLVFSFLSVETGPTS
jgi:hypothetical protein